MRDLRLVGHEDGAVIFESLEGEKYRVLADEALRVSVRNAAIAKPAELSITPRDIQDRIRSGETIEDLAQSTGATIEFIEKFAQPVIYELEHIVQSALAIRITIAGDRYNDDVQEEFGNLIENRLVANGASNLTWTSKRADGGVWLLSANYEINGHRGLALWAFEPRKFHLAPENESAVALSNHNSAMDTPIAKLRTATESTSAPAKSQEKNDASAESAPAAFRKVEETPVEPAPLKAATTSGMLDELRKRRESIELDAVEVVDEVVAESDFDDFIEDEPDPRTGPLQVVPDLDEAAPDEPEHVSEPELETADDTVDAQPEDSELEVSSPDALEETPPTAKKGRAPMPSWDEIVFGTKTDDEI